MKKFTVLSFCLLLTLMFSSQLPAFAASNFTEEDASVDMSDTNLGSQGNTDFNRDVADDEAFINLVIEAAQKKGKDVSLEGVHPGQCIKLYGIKNSENVFTGTV